MVELASQQSGFLGAESARGENGFGITVSYWSTTEAISSSKSNMEHVVAQELGKAEWYANYEIKVAKVERAYGNASISHPPVT